MLTIKNFSFGTANTHSSRKNIFSDISFNKSQAFTIGTFSVLGGMIGGADCYESLKKKPRPDLKYPKAFSTGYGIKIGFIIGAISLIGTAIYNKFFKKST